MAHELDERDRLIPAYGLHERKGIALVELVERLDGEGWRTYTLPGAPSDKETFVASVRSVLPLDPPVTSANWDALSDSLWEGFHQLRVDKVAVARRSSPS